MNQGRGGEKAQSDADEGEPHGDGVKLDGKMKSKRCR